MEEKKNIKKNKIVKVTALLGLFLLVFGVSYALFSVVLNGTKRNRITTGNLSLQLLNEEGNTLNDNTIGLENVVPMTDAEGKALTPYTFVLKNNGTMNAEYSLSLKDLDLAAGEERLDDKYVKIFVEKGNYDYAMEDVGTYVLANAKDRIIDAGVIKAGASERYKVYLWLDQNADNNAMNKVFLTNLEVNGYQINDKTMANTIMYRKGGNGTYDGLVTRYADGRVEVNGTRVSFSELVKSNTSVAETNRSHVENLLYYAEKAGYKIEEQDLSTRRKMKTFLETLKSDPNVEQLQLDEEQKIRKKYNLNNLEDICTECYDEAGYFYIDEYVKFIKDTDPSLARKIAFEMYLIYNSDGYLGSVFDLGGSIIFDENIEHIYIDGGNYKVDQIVLPSKLKELGRITGFTGVTELTIPPSVETIGHSILAAVDLDIDTLTIPATVKTVKERAFYNSRVKTINIMGSTDGWEEGWDTGFNGTINRQG